MLRLDQLPPFFSRCLPVIQISKKITKTRRIVREEENFLCPSILFLLIWELTCERLAGENQTQFNAYMRETQENWVTHQNGWKLYLKYHLQTKKKRECWGYWFGTSKRRKAVDREIEMQMLGKQMCWAIRDNGTQRNFNKQTLLDSFLFINLVHAIVIYGNNSLPGTSSLSTFI